MDENRKESKEWVDTSEIKARLIRYRENEREIVNQIERLGFLEGKLYSVGSPELTDMPKASSPTNDRVAILISQKDELSEEVDKMQKEQAQERQYIESILCQLDRSDERAAIRMRYFDGAKWDEVNQMLFGDMEDFYDKEDSYMKRVTNLHKQALVDMARIIERQRRTCDRIVNKMAENEYNNNKIEE